MKIKNSLISIILINLLFSFNDEFYWESAESFDNNNYSSISIYYNNITNIENNIYAHILDADNQNVKLAVHPMYKSYSHGGEWFVCEYFLKEKEFDLNVLINSSSILNSDSDNLNYYNVSNKSTRSDQLFSQVQNFIINKNYIEGIKFLNDIIADETILYTDIARAKYIMAEVYINDFDNYYMGVDILSQIIDDYPDTNSAKKALFTKGYIYANYLDSYIEAVALYEQFVDLHSNDDLVPSVKYELENLYKIINSID